MYACKNTCVWAYASMYLSIYFLFHFFSNLILDNDPPSTRLSESLMGRHRWNVPHDNNVDLKAIIIAYGKCTTKNKINIINK